MRATISLPDSLFSDAEELARQLGVSRSQLYARALAEFVARQQQTDVTERLNAVYRDQRGELDPALAEVQLASLDEESW